MRALWLAGGVLVALAGCGTDDRQTGEGTSVSRQEVAAALNDGMRPEPGQYRTSVELLELDLPPMAAGVGETVRSSITQAFSQTSLSCLTPEDAESGFKDMLRQTQPGDCRYERFVVADNRLDAAMTCQNNGAGGAARIALLGDVTPTASDVTMTMQATAAPLGDMKMRMRVRSDRLGPCPVQVQGG